MSSADDIAKLLPTLSRTELEQLSTKIKFQLQYKKATNQYESDHWLLLGIAAVTARYGLIPAGRAGVAKLKRLFDGQPYAVYKVDSAVVLENLDPLIRCAEHSPAACRSIGVKFAECLASYQLRQYGKLLEQATLLQHVRELPAAIEFCYPGYLQAGLVWVITGTHANLGQL